MDFGPDGAYTEYTENNSDIDIFTRRFEKSPLDAMQIKPNSIYLNSTNIRICKEINENTVKILENMTQIGDVNWTEDFESVLGFDFLGLVNSLFELDVDFIRASCGDFKVNGPDENSCFEVRTYHLLIITLPLNL
jgi:hypothetical protein